MTRGKLYGVSVGPGDPMLMTLKAVSCIERCAVIAAPRTKDGKSLALTIAGGAVSLAGKTVVYLDLLMTRDADMLSGSYAAAADLVAERLDAGADVALLNLGDASLYGSFSYISRILAERGYDTQTIPGVTSFCACAAASGRSLTDMNAPLHILPASEADLDRALELPGGKVIMKSGKALTDVIGFIRDRGLCEKAVLISDCGLPTQRVCEKLAEAADESYFSTILISP